MQLKLCHLYFLRTQHQHTKQSKHWNSQGCDSMPCLTWYCFSTFWRSQFLTRCHCKPEKIQVGTWFLMKIARPVNKPVLYQCWVTVSAELWGHSNSVVQHVPEQPDERMGYKCCWETTPRIEMYTHNKYRLGWFYYADVLSIKNACTALPWLCCETDT